MREPRGSGPRGSTLPATSLTRCHVVRTLPPRSDIPVGALTAESVHERTGRNVSRRVALASRAHDLHRAPGVARIVAFTVFTCCRSGCPGSLHSPRSSPMAAVSAGIDRGRPTRWRWNGRTRSPPRQAHHPAGSPSTSSTRAASRTCQCARGGSAAVAPVLAGDCCCHSRPRLMAARELPGFGLLAARHGEGLLEALFRLRCIPEQRYSGARVESRARRTAWIAPDALGRGRHLRAAPRRVLCTRCRGVGAQAAAGLTAAPRSRLARAPVQA